MSKAAEAQCDSAEYVSDGEPDFTTRNPEVVARSTDGGNRVKAIGRVAQRIAVYFIVLVIAIVALNGAAGYLIFSRVADSPASRVDAVVVLGGEHDGRESYGMTLVRQRLASALVLSNPYSPSDKVMARMCQHRKGGVDVICARPEPSTTCGEAMMTRRLAEERHWKRILILSWQQHLPRAGLIFRQTLSGMGISVTVRAVPRQYVLPIWYWQYVYFYQFAGIAKAMIAEHC
jgi:uncharacterized SAM-binding protein YcdF (DUF218 family)